MVAEIQLVHVRVGSLAIRRKSGYDLSPIFEIKNYEHGLSILWKGLLTSLTTSCTTLMGWNP